MPARTHPEEIKQISATRHQWQGGDRTTANINALAIRKAAGAIKITGMNHNHLGSGPASPRSPAPKRIRKNGQYWQERSFVRTRERCDKGSSGAVNKSISDHSTMACVNPNAANQGSWCLSGNSLALRASSAAASSKTEKKTSP